MVQIEYGNQEDKLPLLVVPGNGPSLFGRNWLKLICQNWPDIYKVSLELDTLFSKCKDLFKKHFTRLSGEVTCSPWGLSKIL